MRPESFAPHYHAEARSLSEANALFMCFQCVGPKKLAVFCYVKKVVTHYQRLIFLLLRRFSKIKIGSFSKSAVFRYVKKSCNILPTSHFFFNSADFQNKNGRFQACFRKVMRFVCTLLPLLVSHYLLKATSLPHGNEPQNSTGRWSHTII